MEKENLIKTVLCSLCSFSYLGYLVVIVRLRDKRESGEEVTCYMSESQKLRSL